MRITNSMIRNNTSNNMSTNKGYVDTLNTQMSTQKKIDRPSDDPVIAIRALRLRSSLSEINQYYEKNIPDAESWLEVTETALKNMESILTDVYRQCVNGATDHLNESDRNTILTNLQKLREQVYAEGNAEDITQKTYYSGLSSVPTTDDLTAGNLPAGNVEDHTYSRVRLAYDNIDNITQLQYKDANGNLQDIEGMEITYLDADGNTQTATVSYNVHNYTDWQNAQNLNVGDNEVIFVKETGELILGKNVAAYMNSEKPDMVVSYDKTGFKKGEVRPEHYFDCIDTTNANPANHITYTKEDQEINYTIAFGQTLAVNTQASDVFDSSIGRDIDELTDAVQMAITAHKKVSDIENLMKEEKYAGEEDQALLQQWLDAAEKEVSYADDNMKNLYSEGISSFQSYLSDVVLAKTDVGSKGSRLALTKSRMSEQQMTFKKLKSTNEDKELSDIIIDYTAAYNAYQASMQAASKAIKQTLLDYI